MTQRLNEAQRRRARNALAWCLDQKVSPFQFEGPTIPTGLKPDKHDDRTRDTALTGKQHHNHIITFTIRQPEQSSV